jgi:predicted RNase H-like HicB family nuclease
MKKASAREYVIQATWDKVASVWVAESDDVPGLITEAKTFEALLKKLRTLVPELLELNTGAKRRTSVPYRVVAERREIASAA